MIQFEKIFNQLSEEFKNITKEELKEQLKSVGCVPNEPKSEMKLFQVIGHCFENSINDFDDMAVAPSREFLKEKYNKCFRNMKISIDEITEVDGYKIILEKVSESNG